MFRPSRSFARYLRFGIVQIKSTCKESLQGMAAGGRPVARLSFPAKAGYAFADFKAFQDNH